MKLDKIGRRIRYIRLTLDMKGIEFSKELGISQNYLSEIENNKKSPSDMVLKNLSLRYGIPEPWLRAGEGSLPDKIVRKQGITIVPLGAGRRPREGGAVMDDQEGNGNGQRLSKLTSFLIYKWMGGDEAEKARIWQAFEVIFQDFKTFFREARKASLTINLPFERRVGKERRKEKQSITAEIQFAGIPEGVDGEVVQQDDGRLVVRIEQEHLRQLADLKIRLPGQEEITASLIDLVNRSNVCDENEQFHEFALEMPQEVMERFIKDEGKFIVKKRRIRQSQLVVEEEEIKKG